MYSMWKIMCFLNFKPHKHIALHQIHKIMFFLAMSYDPFNFRSFEHHLHTGTRFKRRCGKLMLSEDTVKKNAT